MTDSVCSALGIDRVDLLGKFTLIEEKHGSDGNFILHSFISSALEKNQGICLVLFHNTFGHYHNIGMKLGYNLKVLRERGQISVIEPMKMVPSNIQELGHDSVDAADVEWSEEKPVVVKVPPAYMRYSLHLIEKLFRPLKSEIRELLRHRSSAMVIIEDLSHVFDLKWSMKDAWCLVKLLRGVEEFEQSLSLCVLTHTYDGDREYCEPDLMADILKYKAELYVVVEPLRTGFANNVSGKMNVRWMDSVRIKYNWPDNISYLFKLSDRQVKVFAPGGAALA